MGSVGLRRALSDSYPMLTSYIYVNEVVIICESDRCCYILDIDQTVITFSVKFHDGSIYDHVHRPNQVCNLM